MLTLPLDLSSLASRSFCSAALCLRMRNLPSHYSVLKLKLTTNSNKTDILSQCRTGTDWACFWASLPDQAAKKILKIKDFIKDFT